MSTEMMSLNSTFGNENVYEKASFQRNVRWSISNDKYQLSWLWNCL